MFIIFFTSRSQNYQKYFSCSYYFNLLETRPFRSYIRCQLLGLAPHVLRKGYGNIFVHGSPSQKLIFSQFFTGPKGFVNYKSAPIFQDAFGNAFAEILGLTHPPSGLPPSHDTRPFVIKASRLVFTSFTRIFESLYRNLYNMYMSSLLCNSLKERVNTYKYF